MLALFHLSASQKISNNRTTVDPRSTPETCPLPSGPPVVPSGYYLPPNSLLDAPSPAYNNPPGHNIGTNEGRLHPQLRLAARLADPLNSLTSAAINLLLGNRTLGWAFADISVTGRNSFNNFQKTQPTLPQLVQRVKSKFPGQPPEAITNACMQALSRAFTVASAIRQPSESIDRKAFGWIGVSGEDDMPYRPVNVPSSKYPQYDITVHVPGPTVVPGGMNVNTRYFIAQTRGNGVIPRGTNSSLPALARPVLSPDAEVFLYVHGMDSRAEEAEHLADSLAVLGRKTGRNFAIISVDLPSSGYGDKLDHFKISTLEEIGHPVEDWGFIPDFTANGRHNAPVLQFYENFVVSFVDTLDQQVPIKNQLKAIVGGSLGGNLALRFGRRTDLKWLKKIIAWSPASIWTSLADGADILKHLACRETWFRAGGDPKVRTETPEIRGKWFASVFDEKTSPVNPPNPYMWYRGNWPCIQSAIVADRLDRQETYNSTFRLWHWRLACEQLIYTHQGINPKTNVTLYLENKVPTLLACGVEDAWPYAEICPATQHVSSRMVNTPGLALFLRDTGHAIHSERPNYWAQQWVAFIGA